MNTWSKVGCCLVAGLTCLVAAAEENFRTPEMVLADAICVSATNAFTCGSAPVSCEHEGVIYAPYLAARSGYGEQHKIIALSVFAAENPSEAHSYVIAEAGAAGPAENIKEVVEQLAIWHADKVRVYFLANAEYYYFCDWDPKTKAIVGRYSPVKCVWAGSQTNELTSVPVSAYLTEKGFTGFNLQESQLSHLICTAKPAWRDGAFYGTVTSGLSQPVVFRCADGETFEFVGVVPVIGKCECQVAWLGDTLYALVRSAEDNRNFWTSDDGGVTWTYRASIPMSATRPQLLTWHDKLYVGYSEENVEPNMIRNGRNNMRLMVGTGTDFAAFEQAFRVVDPIGFVYYDLVPSGENMYCLWSNSSVYPNIGGTLGGKDAVFSSRLTVSADDPSDVFWRAAGGKLEVTVRPNLLGASGARLVLAWGETDGGSKPSSWAHTADVGKVTDSGGVWLLEPKDFGIPESCRLRVFIVPYFALLESITSSGSQYLDTGIKHAQNDVVDIDLRMDAFDSSKNSEIYGARDTGGPYFEAFSGRDSAAPRNTFTLADFRDSVESRLKYYHGGTTFDSIAGKRLKIHIGADGNRIRTDDGSVDAAGAATGTATFQMGRNAWVFGVNGAGWSRHPGMTLYALDVNRGLSRTPLRRYRPARFASGALGLRDMLTGEELSNAGGGEFAAGPETNEVAILSSSIACSAVGNWECGYDRVVAAVMDYAGAYDGAGHALSLSIVAPKDGIGCTVRWAWNGAPKEVDFTHAEPGVYTAPGVYTNIVRIVDDEGLRTPCVATGVVTISATPFMVISRRSYLDLVVDSSVIGSTCDSLLLVWDVKDRGETISNWAHRTTIVQALDPTGGVFRVDATALGIADGDSCRVFIAPGFALLESITSSGSQYLDTGIKHAQNDVVDIDLRMDAFDSSKNSEIYGARDKGGPYFEAFSGRDSAAPRNTFTIADFRDSVESRLKYYHGGTTFDSIAGKRLKIHIGADGNRIRTDDGSVDAAGAATGTATFQMGGSAWVFGVNGAGWSRHPGMTLYALDVNRGNPGLPLRRYRPARRADGELGLLDLVTEDFLTNRGTDEFKCGAVTNEFFKSPSAVSSVTTMSLAGDSCLGAATGWTGDYDGRAHAATARVLYPAEGATVRWAWTGSPSLEDFTHVESERHVAPGVYTNVVRVTDGAGTLAPWVATSVVSIARLPIMATSGSAGLEVSVAPGVAAKGGALVLAWGDADAGASNLCDWPHSTVLAELSSDGGTYAVAPSKLTKMGVPKKAVCRFFAMPVWEVLEYAESTSSAQYVNLDCVLKSGYTAEVEAEVPPDADVTDAFGIFGARVSRVSANISVGADENSVFAENNDCRSDATRTLYMAQAKPLVKGSRYRFHVGRPCVVSGAGAATAAQGWMSSDFSTSGSAWLFGINSNNAQAFTASTGVRIYSCVVSNDVQELIVDARPAKDADGNVCIYEAVSDRFLPNAGTGDLIAGPTVGRIPWLNGTPIAASLPLKRPVAAFCLMLR